MPTLRRWKSCQRTGSSGRFGVGPVGAVEDAAAEVDALPAPAPSDMASDILRSSHHSPIRSFPEAGHIAPSGQGDKAFIGIGFVFAIPLAAKISDKARNCVLFLMSCVNSRVTLLRGGDACFGMPRKERKMRGSLRKSQASMRRKGQMERKKRRKRGA